MPISFNAIPGNLRVPLFYAEINAGYSPTVSPSRLLLMGGKTAAGTALADEPMLVTGGEDGLFGVGSMLSTMVKRARYAAPFQEIWAIPVSVGTGATTTITLALAAAAPTGFTTGDFVIYVGDVRIVVAYTAALYTPAAFATSLALAINSNYVATEFTAVATATGVVLTSNCPGAFYNAAMVQTRLLSGDSTLADALITSNVNAATGTDPSIALDLANLGVDEYDFIACPYNTQPNLVLMGTFTANRWGPLTQLYGAAVTYTDGTAGALQTTGALYDDPNLTMYGAYHMSSTGSAITATAAAIHAQHLQSAPELSRPLQTLALPGIRGPKLVSDRLGISAMNTLLFSGISTMTTDRTGAVAIGRAITTYRTDVYGNPDQSFLSPNVRAQLTMGTRFIRGYISQTWGRAALVDANPTGLQNFATVGDLTASILHAYQTLCSLGVFDQFELFAASVIIERDILDPNRVNAYLPFASVNALTVFASNVTSFLRLGA